MEMQIAAVEIVRFSLTISHARRPEPAIPNSELLQAER
jgi:hypothetical protein